MAEAIFLAELNKRGWGSLFIVDSAGTSAFHHGQSYHPETIAVCQRRQVPIRGHSRPVRGDDLEKFDYIVAMDSSNFADLQEKAAGRKSYAKKLSHMLDYSEYEHIPGLDVPDPYYGGREGFERVFDLLSDACVGLLKKIAIDHRFLAVDNKPESKSALKKTNG